MLGTIVVHEFYISHSNNELNLFIVLFDNSEIFEKKFSAVQGMDHQKIPYLF